MLRAYAAHLKRHGDMNFLPKVASLPAVEADALLDWSEETIAETGKPQSMTDGF
jgi:hypothetical protein